MPFRWCTQTGTHRGCEDGMGGGRGEGRGALLLGTAAAVKRGQGATQGLACLGILNETIDL
eukprot:scaffold102205_cov19-Tisochrysis_lutea.AAC.1